MLPVRLVATATALLALVLPTAAHAADPPPVTITSTAAADNGNGDIFLTPTGGTATYANGVEIVDRTGKRHLVPRHPRRPDRDRLPHPDATTASPS